MRNPTAQGAGNSTHASGGLVAGSAILWQSYRVAQDTDADEEHDFLEDLELSIKEGLAGNVITKEESLARVREIARRRENPGA